MLQHVDKVKIPKINSSPSVFSLSLKEKEFGYKWLFVVHIQHEEREVSKSIWAWGEREAGLKFKDLEPPLCEGDWIFLILPKEQVG